MNTGLSMRYMVKHLTLHGYRVYTYSYNSRKYSNRTLSGLNDLVAKITEDDIYLVGHSMGGLVIRNYLNTFKNALQRVKGVVTIGTPHNQSKCAHNLANSILKGFIGTAGSSGLTITAPAWHPSIPIGCIAGVSENRWSTNWFIWRERDLAPNDGTIFVTEAVLDGCTDKVLVTGAHTGLLFNNQVVQQCHHFIMHQKFKK